MIFKVGGKFIVVHYWMSEHRMELRKVLKRAKVNLLLQCLAAAVLVIISFESLSQAAKTDTQAASGTVVTAITVAATQNLEFGNVLQGVPKSIGNNDDDSSAIFTITGDADAGISLNLVLPQYLTLAGGSDRMTIIFNATSLSIDTIGTANPSTVVGNFVNINPYLVPSGVDIGTGGTSKVFLGGKVVPTVNQKAGAYSGDLVLSVSYNGT